MPKFADIKSFSIANYRVNVSWGYLDKWLGEQVQDGAIGVDLDPDFQRGHVWTEDKQIAYVEYRLREGMSARDLYWNHKSWGREYDREHKLVLVDGKQRLEAVRLFMNNKIPAFGALLDEYTDKLRVVTVDFIMCVNDLKTRAEVLQWYLDLNSGGVIHTNDELDKVRELLSQETER